MSCFSFCFLCNFSRESSQPDAFICLSLCLRLSLSSSSSLNCPLPLTLFDSSFFSRLSILPLILGHPQIGSSIHFIPRAFLLFIRTSCTFDTHEQRYTRTMHAYDARERCTRTVHVATHERWCTRMVHKDGARCHSWTMMYKDGARGRGRCTLSLMNDGAWGRCTREKPFSR